MSKNYIVKEIAEILDCNIDVIRRRLQNGEIVGKRTTRRGGWLVTEENFLKYTQGIENPITISKFAKMVRKCAKTIRDKVIRGELRGVKLGRWYVDGNELNKFI